MEKDLKYETRFIFILSGASGSDLVCKQFSLQWTMSSTDTEDYGDDGSLRLVKYSVQTRTNKYLFFSNEKYFFY